MDFPSWKIHFYCENPRYLFGHATNKCSVVNLVLVPPELSRAQPGNKNRTRHRTESKMENDDNFDQDCSKKRPHSQITIESELSPAFGNAAAAPSSSSSQSVRCFSSFSLFANHTTETTNQSLYRYLICYIFR